MRRGMSSLGSKATKAAETIVPQQARDTYGVVRSGADAVKYGAKSYGAFRDGEVWDGTKYGTKALGKALKTGGKLLGNKTMEKVAKPLGAASSAMQFGEDFYQVLDEGAGDGEPVVDAVKSGVGLVGDVAQLAGPAGAPVKKVTDAFAMGVDLYRSGDGYLTKHGVYGSEDGKHRNGSDWAAHLGHDARDWVSDRTGNETLGWIAGGGATLGGSIGAGAAAVGGAIADFATSPIVTPEFMAKLQRVAHRDELKAAGLAASAEVGRDGQRIAGLMRTLQTAGQAESIARSVDAADQAEYIAPQVLEQERRRRRKAKRRAKPFHGLY